MAPTSSSPSGPEDRYGSNEAPTAQSVAKRRTTLAAISDGDEAAVRAFVGDSHAHVRATALVGLQRLGRLTNADIVAALADPSPLLRRQLAQLAAANPAIALTDLVADPDHRVAEMAAWALGERELVTEADLAGLIRMATDHSDALCREAAVAALGAIGDARGLAAILAATADKATVRRRAVLALAPFDTPEVDAALEAALHDRDWQVRQAAEDLL